LRVANQGWLRTLVVVSLILLVGALTVANYRFAVAAQGGNDFIGRWNAAQYWLVRGVNPYDQQVSQATQRLSYGRLADTNRGEDLGDFLYPLPAMLFFGPFGLLPYSLARALWMTLLELCLPALVLMGIRLAHWKTSGPMLAALMLFSALWYHGIRTVVVGNFSVVEAVLITAALLAIQRKQDLMAGILLALSLSKPQMSILLIPFIILWGLFARRWTLLLSTLLSSLVLIGISLILIPTWPILWLRQLVSYTSSAYLGPPVEILARLLPRGERWANLIMSGVFLTGLGWEWIRSLAKGERTFLWVAQATLVVTNLVAYRTATTNFVVMLPALILIFSVWQGRWGRQGAFAIYACLLALLVGLWGLFLATVVGNTESPAMYIPLPFLVLLGLLWVRWWATREIRFQVADGSQA
jgi:hypothetical protein